MDYEPSAIHDRIEELVGVLARLEDESLCPPPRDHVRVARRQRCTCDRCAAVSAIERSLEALRSLAGTHDAAAPAVDERRWMGLDA